MTIGQKMFDVSKTLKYSEVIVETDDDNSPLSNFFKPFKLYEKAKTISNNGWLNICNYFFNIN